MVNSEFFDIFFLIDGINGSLDFVLDLRKRPPGEEVRHRPEDAVDAARKTGRGAPQSSAEKKRARERDRRQAQSGRVGRGTGGSPRGDAEKDADSRAGDPYQASAFAARGIPHAAGRPSERGDDRRLWLDGQRQPQGGRSGGQRDGSLSRAFSEAREGVGQSAAARPPGSRTARPCAAVQKQGAMEKSLQPIEKAQFGDGD
jgi:hypothetical protein